MAEVSDGPLGRALRRLEGREPAGVLLGASAMLTLDLKNDRLRAPVGASMSPDADIEVSVHGPMPLQVQERSRTMLYALLGGILLALIVVIVVIAGGSGPPATLYRRGARVISRAPADVFGLESPMRADVETAAADIEQSIELLRRRL